MKRMIKCAVVVALVPSAPNMGSGMEISFNFSKLSRTNSTTSLPNLSEKGGRIQKMKSFTSKEWNNFEKGSDLSLFTQSSSTNLPEKSGRIPKMKSFTPDDWSNLEKGSDLSLFAQENKQSSSSDEVYEDPIRPYSDEARDDPIHPEDPTEQFVQIDEKNKCVHIDTSHKDENSLFHSMLYRASLFRFTITEMEILDSFGLNNWTKAVKPGWIIHAKDGTTITVIEATEAQNRWRQSKLPGLVQIVSEYKYPRNLKKKVGEKRAKLRESLPRQCPSPNCKFCPRRRSDAEIQTANGNQEEITYEGTNCEYVKFNREKRIIRIEKLPNYNRFNPTPMDMVVRALYGLINLGIKHRFRLDAEKVQKSPLPSILERLIGEGWTIDFDGVQTINVI